MDNGVADLKIANYNYLKSASKEAWSWEFLRRNSDYIRAWKEYLFKDVFEKPLDKKAMSEAAKFGLLFFVDPQMKSKSIDVFWSPKTTSYVLKCSLIQHNLNARLKNIILADVKLKLHYIELSDSCSHLLLKEGTGTIQLMFEDKLNLNTYFDFDIQIPTYCNFSEQLHSVICLEQLLLKQKCNIFKAFSPDKSKRLTEILFAYDLFKLGYLLREIAILVFGEEAVLDNWDGSSDFMKSRTRRLITRGKNLVNAGCSTFLKSK